jgi:hypothetical protein
MRNKEYRGLRISLSSTVAMILFFIATERLFAQAAVEGTDRTEGSGDGEILKYWPIDAPPRHWALADLTEAANATQPPLFISNESLGRGTFILWYSNPERQITKTSNGEEFRSCNSKGRSWIFFDEYLTRSSSGSLTSRPVKSSRIVLTVDGGKSVDLIADGTYAGCGSIGQPYLFSSNAIATYRLQVWGYMANNPKYKWYWDAAVSKPALITNSCLHPPQTLTAMKVQEAWWSNFAVLNGRSSNGGWTLGSSGNLGPDGMPDGIDVKDFRTVWHAEGQIPYFATGTPDGSKMRRCINRMPAPDVGQ